MKRLIVNADDFGLTSGVNRAIIELHQRGVLTSATLMARAQATEEAIALAFANPTLGVGCHIVLVDGEPVLASRRELVWLVDPVRANMQFEQTLGSFLRLIYEPMNPPFKKEKLVAQEIEAETAAQIAFLTNRGLRLTHIDTHKHTHIFPRVLRPVLRAARGAGITKVRNPFEPVWSRVATPGAPLLRRLQVRLLRMLEPAFHRIVAEEGFTTTQGSIGVLATGTLDERTVTSLLHSMPEGDWELVTHPGYNDLELAHAHTRLLASRETEMQALRALESMTDVELRHFGQLTR